MTNWNRYLRIKVPEDEEFEEASSSARLARAKEVGSIDCRTSLLNLLSDTKNKELPFFREGQEGVTTVTLGEIIEWDIGIAYWKIIDSIDEEISTLSQEKKMISWWIEALNGYRLLHPHSIV